MEWDSEWLHFTKRARNGMFFLLIIFIVIAIIPRFYNKFISAQKSPTYELSMLEVIEEDETHSEKIVSESRYAQPDELFNPNDYSLEEWMMVGLSQKQGQSIVNYISKGGKFKTKQDLQKSFVITEELFLLLEPMIDLPDKIENKKEKDVTAYAETKAKNIPKETEKKGNYEVLNKISINLASVEELQFVKGVGPFFAKEIVKLRERYGGIIAVEQLLEIYNMDEEKINAIAPYFKIDANEVVKLDINTATLEELRRHPLIHSDMAKSIVLYREKWGAYTALGDLLATPYIDAKVLKGLMPYLKVE